MPPDSLPAYAPVPQRPVAEPMARWPFARDSATGDPTPIANLVSPQLFATLAHERDPRLKQLPTHPIPNLEGGFVLMSNGDTTPWED